MGPRRCGAGFWLFIAEPRRFYKATPQPIGVAPWYSPKIEMPVGSTSLIALSAGRTFAPTASAPSDLRHRS